MGNIIYSRGYPYGAPMFYLRGGATRTSEVKAVLKKHGFTWNSFSHCWETVFWDTPYIEDGEVKYAASVDILRELRDLGCTIKPKDDLNPTYTLDLDGD